MRRDGRCRNDHFTLLATAGVEHLPWVTMTMTVIILLAQLKLPVCFRGIKRTIDVGYFILRSAVALERPVVRGATDSMVSTSSRKNIVFTIGKFGVLGSKVKAVQGAPARLCRDILPKLASCVLLLISLLRHVVQV